MAAAEISHWLPDCLASKMRMPWPRDQTDFLSTRPSYGLSTSRSRPQQKVRKTLLNELAIEAVRSGSKQITDDDVEHWKPALEREAVFA
jgi:hypothetical protein